ncbi:hypothetical protein ACHAWU_000317 [Discostella pseudostelligera]|uniref:Bacterial surface antigen (D15) domain-containing protein n=1 Tax=Discostella pseudostelligera TaxID=259834 RepID=A0ABD3MW85_9STRA
MKNQHDQGAAAAAQRQKQHQQLLVLEQLQQRKAEFVSKYSLPLNYPAKVHGLAATADNDATTAEEEAATSTRTSSQFINARLLEVGVPLGHSNSSSNSSSLAKHSVAIGKFIRDLEGTGCYDAVQIHLDRASSNNNNNIAARKHQQQQSPENDNDDDDGSSSSYNVTVKLREKKWYKLYIGGGVNSDYNDPTTYSSFSPSSILGGTNNSTTSNANTNNNNFSTFLPKLQFETSASLLNLTGYADISSASYIVDQTGNASFKLVHDRPLVSLLSEKNNGWLYRWLMPNPVGGGAFNDNDDDDDDPSIMMMTVNSFTGGGSQTSLGLHAAFHDVDYESTRSSKEYVRSMGVRLANHSRGNNANYYRPSTSPPESMAGPYLFLDWNASLLDILPKRHPTYPYMLDCSSQIAQLAGTYLKHSLSGGWYWNGSLVNDRSNPTCGYDGYVWGEVAGPPGDVGYWKLKSGYSFHLPVELMLRVGGYNMDDDSTIENVVEGGDGGNYDGADSSSTTVTGMTLHSSFNCGILRPLNFNSLIGNSTIRSSNNNGGTASIIIPPSDRFYVGGPGQLRGFLPAGIGPRANTGGSSVPGGDALGGDIFYTSTLATSVPFPTYLATLRNNGARLFGFVNAGTCCAVSTSSSSTTPLIGMGCLPIWNQILHSTRVSIGGGLSMGSPMGRCELTYAVPIRYGPRDARKSVQFGFGFSFG